MKNKIIYSVCAGYIALALSGCASIMTGGEQKVSFDSGPQGATVYVNDASVGQTPIVATLKRSDKTVVRIEKEGYSTEEFTLATGMTGMFWGNIIIGGLLGSATDSSTGAIHEYTPGEYFVELKAAEQATN